MQQHEKQKQQAKRGRPCLAQKHKSVTTLITIPKEVLEGLNPLQVRKMQAQIRAAANTAIYCSLAKFNIEKI
jgi:hypothetical protein